MERKMEQAMKATPPEELYEYLMDLSIPKTEAEHYAADRIAELEAQLRQKDIQIEMHSDLSEHRQQKLEARLDAVEALYNKSPHYQKLYGPRTVVHFPPDHTVYVEFSRDELKKALEQK
jgi:hypothetical protein